MCEYAQLSITIECDGQVGMETEHQSETVFIFGGKLIGKLKMLKSVSKWRTKLCEY